MKTRIFILFLFCSLFFSAFASDFYWIGGTGNWSNTNHWSNASGGTSAGSLPSNSDNVFFDVNSGTTAFIVTIDGTIDVNNVEITTDSIDLKSTGQTVNFADFLMNSTGTIEFTNTQVNFSGTQWSLQNNPTVTFVNSTIAVLNTGLVQFNGNGKTFNDLVSDASELQLLGGNSFDLLKFNSISVLSIQEGTMLTIDSLATVGNCSQHTIIQSLNPGSGFAQFKKSGYTKFTAEYLTIDSVNAITSGGYNYLIQSSSLDVSSGWTQVGRKYFWVGDGGNWSDLNHWSFVSGGTASATCLPSYGDSIIFDNQSFSSPNQTVVGDVIAYFSYMSWGGVTQSPTWQLDTSAFSNGDVILDPAMKVITSNLANVIEFTGTATLNTENITLDCNLSINMRDNASTLKLVNTLSISDSLGIFLSNGGFDLNDYDLSSGFILVSPQSGTSKTLDLTSSSIILYGGLNAENASNFTFNAGTSSLFIGDTLAASSISRTNYLITSGLNFNDVTLAFLDNGNTQTLSGDNSFQHLSVLKGSKITVDPSSTQTVQQNLLIDGTCEDSVYIQSSSSSVAFFQLNGTVVDVICCYFDSIQAIGATPTVYFSKGEGSSGWVFSSAQATVPSFTTSGGFCLGDTTHFINNSTVFSGNSTDLTSNWYYHDGTGYFEYTSPTDSIFIDYQTDTNQHVFLAKGNFDVVLETINNLNLCKNYDTLSIHISSPSALLSSSNINHVICKNDSVTFNVSSDSPTAVFQFYVNGVPATGMSANDTLFATNSLLNNDTISVLSFENGCVSPTEPQMVFTVNELPVFSLMTNPTSTSICEQDTVTFQASSSDSIVIYQFLLNDAPIFVGSSYSNNQLQNNDVVALVATDTNGCKDTISTIYTVLPLPATSLVASNTNNVICSGEEITFTASGATSYEYFVDNVSQGPPSSLNTFSTSSLTTGEVVSVVGYNASGCKKVAPQEFSYTVNALPNVTLSASEPTAICSGTNVQFTATGGSQYEFFINNTSVQGPSSLNTFNTSTLNDNDNVYVKGLFSGCADTSVHKVFSVSSTPILTFSSDATGNTICNNDLVTFSASGATNYEFFIDGVSQGVSSSVSSFSSSSLNNNQQVSVIGESNGCTESQSITMTVLPIPSVGLYSDDPDNTICSNDAITFTATNSTEYQFLVDNTPVGSPQTTPTFSPSLSNGTHAISVIGFAANGCSDTASSSILLTIHSIPTVVLTSSDPDNEICENETVTLTASGSDEYQFYIDGSSQGNMSATNSFVTNSLLNGQTISVLGSSYGCESTSNSISFVVHPSPSVGISSSDMDNMFCENDTVEYTASGATDYEFFINQVSQGAPSVTQTMNVFGLVAGNYDVTVVGTENNCMDSSSLSIIVNGLPSVSLTSSLTNDSICSGESVVYTATGANTYEFFINGVSQGSANYLNTFSSSGLADGEVISTQGTSIYGCKNVVTLPAIHVLNTPVIQLVSSTSNDSICDNDLVTLTAAGGSNYQFFINGIDQGPFSMDSILTSTSLQDGDQIFVIGDSLSCQAQSQTHTFTVFNYPTVSLNNIGSDQICENELINVVASGATSYQFLINNTPVGPYSLNDTFTTTVNDNDIVTVYGSLHGCVSSSTNNVQFEVLAFPILSVISSSSNGVICKGEQVTLTSSGATSYVYQLNNSIVQNTSNSQYSNNDLENGDSIIVIGYNGHCASSDSIFVFTVNTMNLSLSVSPSSIVCGDSPVTFQAAGADEYEFYVNGISQGAFSAISSLNLPSMNDLDTVTFIGKNNTTLCEQENGDYIIMNVMSEPTISTSSSLDFCEGDSVILTSNSSYGNQWMLNGVAINGATDSSFVAYESGIYSLDITHGGNGNIWSVGDNGAGVFGDSTNFNSWSPKKASSNKKFISLSSGEGFVLALDDQGDVYSWGLNDFGQLGDGTYTNSNYPSLVPSISNIKCVATSAKSSMALTTSGEVYVWGENIEGQLGTGNTSVINFPYLNTNLSNIDTIVGGEDHFLFLKNDGTVWSVGGNSAGQLGIGSLSNSLLPQQVIGLANIKAIGAGYNTSFAIGQNGRLYVWGENEVGQLGLGDNANRLTPVISPLKHIVEAQGGAKHSAFLTESHEVFTSGQNNYGQLGDGLFVNSLVPTKVEISGVRQIATGKNTTLIRRLDGTVFGFGSNVYGELSTINEDSVSSPVLLSIVDGVTFIDGGLLTSHFIYGTTNTCSSTSNPTVNVTAVPTVEIIVNNGVDLSVNVVGNVYQWYLNGLAIPGATQSTLSATTNGTYSVEVFFGNGCSGYSNEVNIDLLSVDKVDEIHSLLGYPNPTSGSFNLIFNEQLTNNDLTLVLYNAIGKKVKEIHTLIKPIVQLSLDGISKGAYTLKVINSEFVGVLKVIKK